MLKIKEAAQIIIGKPVNGHLGGGGGGGIQTRPIANSAPNPLGPYCHRHVPISVLPNKLGPLQIQPLTHSAPIVIDMYLSQCCQTN